MKGPWERHGFSLYQNKGMKQKSKEQERTYQVFETVGGLDGLPSIRMEICDLESQEGTSPAWGVTCGDGRVKVEDEREEGTRNGVFFKGAFCLAVHSFEAVQALQSHGLFYLLLLLLLRLTARCLCDTEIQICS